MLHQTIVLAMLGGFLLSIVSCSPAGPRARSEGGEPRVSFTLTFSSRDGSRTVTLTSGEAGASSPHYALAATGNTAINGVSLTLTDPQGNFSTFDANAVPSNLTVLAGLLAGTSEVVSAEIRFNYLDSGLVYQPFTLTFPATLSAATDPADGATVYSVTGSDAVTLAIPDDVLAAVKAYAHAQPTPVEFHPGPIRVDIGGVSVAFNEEHIGPSDCVFDFTAEQAASGSPLVNINYQYISGPCNTLVLETAAVTPDIAQEISLNGGRVLDLVWVQMRDTVIDRVALVGLWLDLTVSPANITQDDSGIQFTINVPTGDDETYYVTETIPEDEEQYYIAVPTPERCGPDVTQWFLKDMKRHYDYAVNSAANKNGELALWDFYIQGKYQLAHKWMTFPKPADCATGRCVNTVWVCDRCLRRNVLGNIGLGVAANGRGSVKPPTTYFPTADACIRKAYENPAVKYWIDPRTGKPVERKDNLAAFGVGAAMGRAFAQYGDNITTEQFCDAFAQQNVNEFASVDGNNSRRIVLEDLTTILTPDGPWDTRSCERCTNADGSNAEVPADGPSSFDYFKKLERAHEAYRKQYANGLAPPMSLDKWLDSLSRSTQNPVPDAWSKR